MLLVFLACTANKDSTLDTSSSDPYWQALGEEEPSALLCVQGLSSSDLWVVGADTGGGPAAMHYDGSSWSQLSTGTTGHLWWVRPFESSVWMVGAGGQVLKVVDGTVVDTWILEQTMTWFGIWGVSESDVWVVGGDPSSGTGSAIYHYNGTDWSKADIPVEGSSAISLFKVWGSSASDVWAVGSGGVALHYDGNTWNFSNTGSTRNLFTAHGSSNVVYGVGGSSSGSILRFDGSTWTDETPSMVMQLNGVHATSADEAVAVGNSGSIWRRTSTGWTEDTRKNPLYNDFHAVWVDEQGGAWAVGGHLSAEPLIDGMLFYLGTDSPASL